MKEKGIFVGLLAGIVYGVYRFATWEPASPIEDVIRNICIPIALTFLAIRGIVSIPDDNKK
ncbi:hypothetical protein HZB69_00320 [Candidatus Amesbacteria bacterium]|nr:hypothetical protein [Candidatus Amesbacteria bacterium]